MTFILPLYQTELRPRAQPDDPTTRANERCCTHHIGHSLIRARCRGRLPDALDATTEAIATHPTPPIGTVPTDAKQVPKGVWRGPFEPKAARQLAKGPCVAVPVTRHERAKRRCTLHGTSGRKGLVHGTMLRYEQPGISGQSVAFSPFFPDTMACVGGQHYGIAASDARLTCCRGCERQRAMTTTLTCSAACIGLGVAQRSVCTTRRPPECELYMNTMGAQLSGAVFKCHFTCGMLHTCCPF